MRKDLNILTLIVIILFNGLSSMAQLLPAGSEYLGKGINLIEGDKKPNLIMLLQKLSVSDIGHTGRGGGILQAVSETSKNVTEATSKMSLKLGLEAEYGAFSASASMKYSNEEKEKTETQLVTITKDLEIASLSMNSRSYNLESNFKRDLNDPAFSPKELFKFYGTHISLGVKVGGRFSGFFSTYEMTKVSTSEIEIAAKATYGGVTGSADFNKELNNSNTDIKIKSDWSVMGGSPETAARLESTKNSANFTAWAKSTETFPGFYAFTSIKPIWELADDSKRKTELEDAFHYAFTKKSLDNLQRFTNTSELNKGIFNASLSVPDGYKILSGGAKCNYGAGYGNLLIGTYPASESQWVAYMMDKHEPSYATLSVYVMAVYDPFDLLDVQIISKKDPEKKKTAEINSGSYNTNGYVLVGGGSKVDYERPGNMLRGSYPKIINDAGSWISKSIDHMIDGPAYISSYAIFLRFRGNSPYKLESRLFEAESVPSSIIKFNASVGYGYHLVGGGAYTIASSGGGVWNFLTGTYPEDNKWVAESKDHAVSSPGILHVIAIGLKVIEKR